MLELFINSSFMGWAYSTIMILYGLTTIGIILVVVSENRNPLKSLAWVTVLLLLPVVGIVLYIFFGRSFKNTRMISRRNRRKLKSRQRIPNTDIKSLDLTQASRQQIALGRSLTGAHYFPDNKVEIFTDGRSKFESLINDLRKARHYINLQYYIFDDDATGHLIRDILIDRARAGVTVRVVYDHVGSFSTKSRFFNEMKREGIQAYPFFKVTFPQLGTRINWRNHRKIVIIDGKTGYIGGMNIADRYITGGKFDRWRDTHLRITGPAVVGLQFSFAIDWNFMGQPLIEETVDTKAPADGNVGLQIITAGPTSQWRNIALAFHKAIATATRRVYIQTPYFLPTEALLKALQTAALAHVDVRLLLPRHSDSHMLTLASASYIDECLKSGIKIYYYEAGMLHSKMIVIDDEISTVGSTNFDFRSFEHNFEANAFMFSKELNARLAAIFMDDLRLSTRILPSDWRRRPWHRKLAESAVRLLSPIL
ncbi:MAG: cardiolipin synthase [Muribaculaceae bacterium]|nr:cardiolipin synthase [Muribaculaceae bacterium]MDE6332011.1 cardiolipin synthase [Muribaculaceae bacterium]